MTRRFEPLADGRRSIRLSGFDYARNGAYFVTVVVAGRKRILGSVRGGVMVPGGAGRAAQEAWERLPAHYPHVRLDEFVVMPDHVHGIIMLTGDIPDVGTAGAGRSGAPGDGPGAEQVGAGLRPAPTVARATIPTPRDVPIPPPRHALPEIVRAFKSFSARAINAHRGTPGTRVWQRNYYERVIRDQRHLDAVRRYIRRNPAAWAKAAPRPGPY